MIAPPPRKRRWILAPSQLGLFGSVCTHAAIILALLFGFMGRAGGAGKGGLGGSGDADTTIDISLTGSSALPIVPGVIATPPPASTAQKTVEEKVEPKTEDPAEQKTEEKAEPQPDDSKHLPPLPQAVAPPANAGGTGATAGGSGKAPGPSRIGFPGNGIDGSSVDGQRALLPSAATCADPVAGRWEALKYSRNRGDWVHFTMVVRRFEGGALSGTILSRTWSGTAFDRVPPPCTLGAFDVTVTMNASGAVDRTGRITFGASRYSVLMVGCDSLRADYAPDHFTGVIDSSREEFQSINNDGASDVDAPYVFRRTGCL